MKYKIQVITKIPDVDEDDGNLAGNVLVGDYDVGNDDIYYRPFNKCDLVKTKNKINIKEEVFALGEILIVDDCDREVGGIERKPSKWYVEYKKFDLKDIKKAIKLSKKIMKNNLKKYEI